MSDLLLPDLASFQEMMKTLLLATCVVVCTLLCSAFACPDDARNSVSQTAEWTVYRNEEYAYEIRYPAELVFDLTGGEGERDGREFQISQGMAYGPCLRCSVYPAMSALDIYRDRWGPTSRMVPGIAKIVQHSDEDSLAWTYDIARSAIGDKKVLVEEARWVPSETFTGRSLFLDGVAFVYSPGGVDPEGDGPVNWSTVIEIVSSFRFLPGSEPSNQD
jgi:hypothetical protein